MKKVICSQKAPGQSALTVKLLKQTEWCSVSGQLPIDAATGVMAEGAGSPRPANRWRM